jgi:hypothetical protein
MDILDIAEQIIAGIAIIAILAALAWVRKFCIDLNHAFAKIRSLERKVHDIEKKL